MKIDVYFGYSTGTPERRSMRAHAKRLLDAAARKGWRGLKGLVLGSETQKVLTHARVPVLVVR